MSRWIPRLAVAAVLLTVLRSPTTYADLVLSPWASQSSPTVIDFSQFAGSIVFTTGPIAIGGLVGESVIWQTNQPSSTTVIGDPSFGLGDNGTWESGRNGYTALNLETGYMDYLFANPVSGVGGFMSYGYSEGNPEPNPPQIVALDSTFSPLENYVLTTDAPIITSVPNDGAFRGISRVSNDIYGFRVRDSGIVLDDLTFVRTQTPTVFSDTVDVYQVIDDALLFPGPPEAEWSHTNPYPGDYEEALAKGEIAGAVLTIVADDVDLGDRIEITFTDKDGIDHVLGTLEEMDFSDVFGVEPGPGNSDPGHITTTSFDIDPSWLNGVDVTAGVTSFHVVIPTNQAEIETSTLSVSYIPLPPSLWMGLTMLVGMGIVSRCRQ